MDIEWGKDGVDGKLYILQAPARDGEEPAGRQGRAALQAQGQRDGAGRGRAIGRRSARARCASSTASPTWTPVQAGDVLVTDMTDPNWEPVMKRAAAIVTNRGGRTCHAAIIARELGIPAVVGCGNATEVLKDGALVTGGLLRGDTGYIYDGLLETEVSDVQRGELPYCPVKIMMNVGNPQLAFDFAQMPNSASAWRGSSSSSTTTSACTRRRSSTIRTSTAT
jgi:pyruvate,water dikinase